MRKSMASRHRIEADRTRWLNRRHFLGEMGTCLGSIAATWLLAREARTAELDTAAPLRPHFQPKAQRILQIFCPGAVSHLDTFEYKPELIKRHGQPLPGNEKLVTFQGGNGNLLKSPW